MTNQIRQSNKYLVYARKSTDDADNQKNSIDYQVGECLRYAKNNNLLITNDSIDGIAETGIIKEKHTAYKTSGITLRNDGNVHYQIDRPKFKKLVELLTKKQYAGVVCLCWDRVSRNDQDGMVIKSLINNGVDVRFVQTKYERTSSGALHMDIDGMFAAHYSRVISEKVKAAYSKLRSEGKCTYIAPIGYLDYGSDHKPLDPDRAPLVKQVFELYGTGGWGFNQLAKWANQQGLTTKPCRNKRNPKEIMDGIDNYHPKMGHKITEKSIAHILKNPFYIGKLKVDDDIMDGIHQPLINVSLYNKVQAILRSKQVSVYYVDKEFCTYRGMIKCSCGRSYSPYEQKGNMYYRCRCLETCDSTDVNLNEREIDHQIEALLGQIYFSDQELIEINARAKFGLQEVSNRRNADIETLQKRQRRIYEDIDYINQNKITLLRTATFTPQQLNDDITRLQQELEDVESLMSAQKESTMEMLQYVITFSELVKNAQLYYKHALDTEKRDVSIQVFSELNFHNGNLANFKTKEGFSALFNRHLAPVGSEGGDRTRGQEINSLLLYR